MNEIIGMRMEGTLPEENTVNFYEVLISTQSGKRPVLDGEAYSWEGVVGLVKEVQEKKPDYLCADVKAHKKDGTVSQAYYFKAE
ncbi:MAG: hypothetical protein V3G42_14120 [Oscillospiraceae bacterium]